MVLSSIGSAQAANRAYATPDNVLLGMHFMHARTDCNTCGGSRDIAPGFWDYVEHMPEDLEHMSYADFWHWWSEFERYKGDEKGLADFDQIVDACIARGMKVKLDVAWTTWWTQNQDWEKESNTAFGAHDLDDWVHLCDLLARRYRGRVALILLQGEANSLDGYWQGESIEHVSECYRLGYKAIKRIDPAMLVSIAGASPSVPREALDDWVKKHATACKGYFDDISMNYFGDVADPYNGLDNYHDSIRKILDDLGLEQVEIGSGESSFQWAENSATITKDPPRTITDEPEKMPACELKQAWRCNESLGEFFDVGENKFVMWGTEYAPGLGWSWRWGFRKFQDWWGVWPNEYKIPGTNIVFGNDTADKVKIDLRPGWTSRETDPFHPMWSVYKFWAQTCPPASEAVRLPMTVTGTAARVFKIATYLQNQDRCVALFQNDAQTKASVTLDLRETGWSDGEALIVTTKNQSIDYATGSVTDNWERTVKKSVGKGSVELDLPRAAGFTTVDVALAAPKLDAELAGQVLPERVEVGNTEKCLVTVKNTGKSAWIKGSVAVFSYDAPDAPKPASWKIDREVKPGDSVMVTVSLPKADAPGRIARTFRMRDKKSGWFGPMFAVAARVTDSECPRKLVAFRERGHIRLKWFAPENSDAVQSYEVYRADGFQKPFSLITAVQGTDYVDSVPVPDKAYYYQVAAIDANGRRSRMSNEDNAKAISQPRFWDAEIVDCHVPARMKLGEPTTVTLTIRNSGSKTWDLSNPEGARIFLNTTQQWGCQDEGLLPDIALGSAPVKPGEEIKVSLPYAAPREGRFENHWVLCGDMAGKGRFYFGTPLLAETVVDPK